MQVIHIYMKEYPLFLKALEKIFTTRNIDYVLSENELHYHNKIYRFFAEDKDLKEEEEKSILYEVQKATSIKDFPLYQIPIQETSFTMRPDPIYVKPISKKKLLKQGKMNKKDMLR